MNSGLHAEREHVVRRPPSPEHVLPHRCVHLLSHVPPLASFQGSFPLSILLAPLSSLIGAFTRHYQTCCWSFVLHYISVLPILSMFLFVGLTPFVGKAVVSILLLLFIKMVENQVRLVGSVRRSYCCRLSRFWRQRRRLRRRRKVSGSCEGPCLLQI